MARANEFNITGITLSLAQGVVKNIIPAIAATNAIIAASCCHEAFKMVTGTAPVLKNYMMYTGDDGVYTYTFEHQQRPDCPVCGAQSLKIKVSPETTLQEFMDMLLDMREV